jgi:hypothetical protein
MLPAPALPTRWPAARKWPSIVTSSDPATQTEAPEILRGLIGRVSVRHLTEGFEVELDGKIANMVRLSAGAESLENEPYRSSVKVVAGGGFEPPTFRL